MKNMDYFYGIRFGSFLIIWFVLTTTVFNSNEPRSIMSALILYFIPISIDYYGHTPIQNKNIKRKNFALWSSMGLTVILLALLLSDINLEPMINNLWVKFIFMILSGIFVFLSCFDWITYSSEVEVKHREKLREIHLHQQEAQSFESRVNEYERSRSTKESVEV